MGKEENEVSTGMSDGRGHAYASIAPEARTPDEALLREKVERCASVYVTMLVFCRPAFTLAAVAR